MKFPVVLLIVVSIAVTACTTGSSDEDGLLSMPTGVISESNFRDGVRASLARPEASSQCDAIAGLSGTEVARKLGWLEDPAVDILTPPPTPKVKDIERAANIVQEECRLVR